jgi:hypothetical protein
MSPRLVPINSFFRSAAPTPVLDRLLPTVKVCNEVAAAFYFFPIVIRVLFDGIAGRASSALHTGSALGLAGPTTPAVNRSRFLSIVPATAPHLGAGNAAWTPRAERVHARKTTEKASAHG